MGVEQDGLGCFEIFGIFYEIKAALGSCGVYGGLLNQGDTGGAHEGPARLQADFRCFITMELQQGRGNMGAGRHDFGKGCIDEEQHRRDEGRQAASQFGGPFHRHIARAGFIHDKTDRICARGHSRIHVFFPRQAADLDAGTD